MPRKNPLPAREMDICRRLRQVRQEVGLSRVVLARDLGIDSSLLATYEHGRAPLRYEIADKACRTLNICQRWLADDLPPRRYYVPIEPSLQGSIPPRLLYSSAYDRFLKSTLENYFDEIEDNLSESLWRHGLGEMDGAPLLRGMSRQELFLALMAMLKSRVDELPNYLLEEYYRFVSASHREFCVSHASQILEHLKSVEATAQGKKSLTNTSPKSTESAMLSPLRRLLERLKRVTAERGKKQELADYLKVSHARVSEWIAGKKEPGGESTLRLLDWVEKQERAITNQKSPGSAENTARAETQPKSHAKPRSGPT